MLVTDHTKRSLAHKRFSRERQKMGWEPMSVDFGIGNLWEIARGYRRDHKITDSAVCPCGHEVWVKVEKINERQGRIMRSLEDICLDLAAAQSAKRQHDYSNVANSLSDEVAKTIERGARLDRQIMQLTAEKDAWVRLPKI